MANCRWYNQPGWLCKMGPKGPSGPPGPTSEPFYNLIDTVTGIFRDQQTAGYLQLSNNDGVQTFSEIVPSQPGFALDDQNLFVPTARMLIRVFLNVRLNYIDFDRIDVAITAGSTEKLKTNALGYYIGDTPTFEAIFSTDIMLSGLVIISPSNPLRISTDRATFNSNGALAIEFIRFL